MPKSKQVIAGYIPVIHKGYLKFFEKFPDAKTIYVFDDDLIKLSGYLYKDIRALSPKLATNIIKDLKLFSEVKLLNQKTIKDLANELIIMPDDDIAHLVAEKYLSNKKIKYYPIFLRWDRRKLDDINSPIQPDRTSNDRADLKFMRTAQQEATKSSDIWRRVGATLVDKTGKLVSSSCNRSLPTQHSPWIDGDIRLNAKRGVELDAYNTIHAEAYLVAEAARSGHSLAGAKMYVTDFPCPQCAKLIAEAGIEKLYYREGYAVANGVEALKAAKVEIIEVNTKDLPDKEGELEVYKRPAES